MLIGRREDPAFSKSQREPGRGICEHTRMVVDEELQFELVEPGAAMKKASESGGLLYIQYPENFELLLSYTLPGNRDLSSGSTIRC